MSYTTVAMYLLEDMDSFFCGQASQQGVRVGSFVEGACLYQEMGSSCFESSSFPPVIWEVPSFYPYDDRGSPVYSRRYRLDNQEGSCFWEVLYSDMPCPAIL
ncbi:UNVERIFIED_CONTAM: hypothetical protein Sradi_3810200 [Sesamum radiatum]|uniref:Uncharacterized protein n=1 Tax=Sesamum radiatum TaxID=300843 RepID=A0AAW2Q0L3_SESRA